jgi:hypothetical protein
LRRGLYEAFPVRIPERSGRDESPLILGNALAAYGSKKAQGNPARRVTYVREGLLPLRREVSAPG